MRSLRRLFIVMAELMQVVSILAWTIGGTWAGGRLADFAIDYGYVARSLAEGRRFQCGSRCRRRGRFRNLRNRCRDRVCVRTDRTQHQGCCSLLHRAQEKRGSDYARYEVGRSCHGRSTWKSSRERFIWAELALAGIILWFVIEWLPPMPDGSVLHLRHLAWPFVLISPTFNRAFAVHAQRSSRVGEGGKWPSCALSYSLIYLGVQAVSDRIADKKELDMPG